MTPRVTPEVLDELDQAPACWYRFQRTDARITRVFIALSDGPDAPVHEYTGPYELTLRLSRDGHFKVTRFQPFPSPKEGPQ